MKAIKHEFIAESYRTKSEYIDKKFKKWLNWSKFQLAIFLLTQYSSDHGNQTIFLIFLIAL